jgi:hypothetical protein
VLGFYAAVLAILEAGVIGVIAVLATQHSLRYLVPWVLGFGAVVLVLLLVIVVLMNLIAPMKLQLGQVTGRELIEYERLTLGDSIGGDFVQDVPTIRSPLVQPPEPGQLEQPQEDQER